MNTVYFAKHPRLNFHEKLKEELRSLIPPGKKVALKMHMGEPGNPYFIKPEFARQIVDSLKEIGVHPFIFDSLVIYPGPRNNVKGYLEAAAKHGYHEKEMGCPVLVSNDSIDVKREGYEFPFQVCAPLAKADFVVVLSHVKGHICCGFGGAIKNLGMGAVSKATKKAIHDGGKPVYLSGCTLCGACVESCLLDNVRLDDVQQRPYFDKNWCCGCSDCVYACPNGALRCSVDFFDKLLSEGACAALSRFKGYYFINCLMNIAKECDCMPSATPIIARDAGVLLGRDIVSIEKASLDIISDREGKDVFLQANKKSPLVHIQEAEKLGMGKMGYRLVEL